ncbi:MAG: tetratricopeptide repeat protein [Candidatus Lokiarchaeota archaeon]|nr:tetratricopeptide repeat protein [Candidatus Lokiarchaeota archaeon]
MIEDGELEKALPFYSAMIQYQDHLLNDSTIAMMNNNYAYVLAKLSRFEEALPYAEKAIRKNPEDHHAWHTHGLIMHQMGNHKTAEESYRKSIEGDRKHWEAWDDLIRLLDETNQAPKLEQAKRELTQAKSSEEDRTGSRLGRLFT